MSLICRLTRQKSSPEHADIVTNLSATTAHLDFDTHGYHSHLSTTVSSTSQTPMNTADLENIVPSLPTGWSSGGLAATVEKKTATVKAPEEKNERSRPRHKLPKGAVAGKEFTEDVRLSFIEASSLIVLVFQPFCATSTSLLLKFNYLRRLMRHSPKGGSLFARDCHTLLLRAKRRAPRRVWVRASRREVLAATLEAVAAAERTRKVKGNNDCGPAM